MTKTAPTLPNSKGIADADVEGSELFLVSEEVIREFVGDLKLCAVHKIATCLVMMSEIAEGLLAGELESDYLDTLRSTARELAGEQSSAFVEAIVAAIDQGKEGLRSLIRTVDRASHLTINYTRSESEDSELADIDRLRFAVLAQRQKCRSKKKTRAQRPATTEKSFAPRLRGAGYCLNSRRSSKRRGELGRQG